MSKEALGHVLPQESAENLRNLPDDLSEKLGEVILGLSHIELHQMGKESGETDYEQPISKLELGPEHKPHIDRITGLMRSASELMAEAYQALSEDGEGLQDNAGHVLQKAKEIAIGKAVELKTEDETSAAVEQLKFSLVLGTMLGSDERMGLYFNGDKQVSTTAIVRKGLAEELLTAVQETQGVVYVHQESTFEGLDRIAAAPLHRGYEGPSGVLKIAANLDFDENYDYQTPLEEGRSEQVDQKRREIIESLSSEELASLSTDAQRNMNKPDLAVSYGELAIGGYIRRESPLSPDAIAEVLTVIHEASGSEGRISAELQMITNELLNMRVPNATHSRNNMREPSEVDQVLVKLLLSGQEEVAKQLISGAASDQDSSRWEHYFSWLTPENPSELLEKIEDASIEKAKTIRDQLKQHNLSERDVEIILRDLQVPEKALEASSEYWEIIHEVFDVAGGGPLANHGELAETQYELARFIGQETIYDFGLMSKLVVIAHENDLPLDVFIQPDVYLVGTEEEVMAEVEERIHLKLPVEGFIEEFNGAFNDNVGNEVTYQEVVRFARQFENPAKALQILIDLYSYEFQGQDLSYQRPDRLFYQLKSHLFEVMGEREGAYNYEQRTDLLDIPEEDLDRLREVKGLFGGSMTALDGYTIRTLLRDPNFKQRLDIIATLQGDIRGEGYLSASETDVEIAKSIFLTGSQLEEVGRRLADERFLGLISEGGQFARHKSEVIKLALQNDLDKLLPFLNSKNLEALLSSGSAYSGTPGEILRLADHENAEELLYLLSNPELMTHLAEEGLYSGRKGQLLSIAGKPRFRRVVEALLDGEMIQALESGGVLHSSKNYIEETIFNGGSEVVFELLSDKELLELVRPESEYADLAPEIVRWVLSERFERTKILETFNNQDLVNLIGSQSPAYFMASALLQEILESDDPGQVIETYRSIFSESTSFWKLSANLTMYKYDHLRFTAHPTSNLSKLPRALPADSQAGYLPEGVDYVTGQDAVDYLRLAGASDGAVTAYEEKGEVNLSELPEEMIKSVLISNIYETSAMSRDQTLRLEASERNAPLTMGDVISEGNLSHRSSLEVLSKIIQNGCLPGEFLLDDATEDMTSLASDFVRITTPEGASLRSIINSLGNSSYGAVNIVFRRGEGSHRDGEEYPAGLVTAEHYVVSGGLPSTEIMGIVVPVASTDLLTLTSILVQNDFFVPVFDEDGSQLFTYDAYKEMREEGNYENSRPVNIDGSVRQPDSQKGSNEGAVFVLPEVNGIEAGRYYVKFSTEADQQHLWNELLADSIYAAVDPRLVPTTFAVFIEGRMARASKIAEADEIAVTQEARNAGFILDALLGNWDAVYNEANLYMSGGSALRIDTGNSLFYRARGAKKLPDAFSATVTELEVGDDSKKLGGGMRQLYPGLTQEAVGQQVEALVELTDEKINELVNGVRLPREYREEVARILVQRRDYIISWSASQPVAA